MHHHLAFLLILGLVAAGCGGEVAATSTTPADTTSTTTLVVLTGTVDLAIGGFDGDRDTICWGHEGYDDIREGANVVALDGDGNTLGVTDLGGGVYYTPPDGEWFETVCRFQFEVELVREAPFYTVEIAGREGPTFTEDGLDADGWHMELTLG